MLDAIIKEQSNVGLSSAQISLSASSLTIMGAKSPYGNEDCPTGYYCKKGRAILCPAGSYCAAPGLVEKRPCPPGQYSPGQGEFGCRLCPAGTFCLYPG